MLKDPPIRAAARRFASRECRVQLVKVTFLISRGETPDLDWVPSGIRPFAGYRSAQKKKRAVNRAQHAGEELS